MASVETLNAREWRRLAETISRGNCVLLLGPGIAVDSDGHTPLSVSFAHELADQLDEDARDIVNTDELAHVAQIYLTQDKFDRTDLELATKDFYEHHVRQIPPIYDALAKLPFTLCVTTTPDDFMVRAFESVGKQPSSHHYNFRHDNFRGGAGARFGTPDPKRPLVFGLYGGIATPESLILSESDLLDFLVNVIKGTPPLPPALIARFNAPEASFLFLGFGFRNWYIRILLHVLQAQSTDKRRSFALEDQDFFTLPDHAETAVFFRKQHTIFFKLLPWSDLTDQLSKLPIQFDEDDPAPAGPPARKPVVFLCHSRDDSQAIVELGEYLQREGVDVWIDQEKIRSGDEWDPLIVSVLRDVDYVLVVQSPNMEARIESYAFKEIRVALERQQRVAEGYRFILSVKLEPCKGVPNLAHLQAIDLSTSDGRSRLVSTIRDDWTRRPQSSMS